MWLSGFFFSTGFGVENFDEEPYPLPNVNGAILKKVNEKVKSLTKSAESM